MITVHYINPNDDVSIMYICAPNNIILFVHLLSIFYISANLLGFQITNKQIKNKQNKQKKTLSFSSCSWYPYWWNRK